MKLDLYRRPDGALVVVPSRFAHALPDSDFETLRYVRTVGMQLGLLGDDLVLGIGLHGFALAQGADAALLRNTDSAVEHTQRQVG